MIDYSDISVIVQGPVYDLDNVGRKITHEVCKSIRRYLPGAELILSTWEGERTEGIDYDVLILNEKINANKIRMPFTGKLKLHTVNHQIITSLNGIKAASKRYVLKLRSDLCLTGDAFIEYYEKYNDYPSDEDLLKWKVFDHRVVTLPTYNVRKKNGLAFNICDWMFFGLKKDVEFYFDIPLVDTFHLFVRDGEEYPRVEDNFGAEQILWVSCLKKVMPLQIENALDKSGTIMTDFEKSLALNFIPISAAQACVYNMQYGVGGYGVKPCLSHGLYLLEEWEKLYNLFGGGKIKVKYHISEHFLRMIYNFKELLRDKVPVFDKAYGALFGSVNKRRLR